MLVANMPNTMQWTHRLWRGVIARCPWSHTGPAGPAALPLLLRSSLFFLSSLWLAISLIFDTLKDLLQYSVFWLLDPFTVPYKEKTQRLHTRAAVLIELKLIPVQQATHINIFDTYLLLQWHRTATHKPRVCQQFDFVWFCFHVSGMLHNNDFATDQCWEIILRLVKII